jgi:hypothetical protein
MTGETPSNPLDVPAGQRMTPSGPFRASSGAFPAHPSNELRTSDAGDTFGFRAGDVQSAAMAERRTWPLYAVIGGAALISSIVVAVAMTSGASGPTANLAKTIEPAASGPGAPPAITEPRPPGSSTITVVPIDPPPEPESASGPSPSPDDLRAALAEARGSSASRATPLSVTKAGTTRRGSATTNPVRSAELPAAVRSAFRHEPSIPRSSNDEITRASSDGRHDKVVALCGAGPISAEHAPLCFLAACHIGDEPRARKLIAAVPAASRDRLIANCQQIGVDVTRPAKPAVDCEAEPMACQH